MSVAITLVNRRVSATAEIRHAVSADIREPERVAAVTIPARRGPRGRDGDDGQPGRDGADGGIQDNTILDGGFF